MTDSIIIIVLFLISVIQSAYILFRGVMSRKYPEMNRDLEFVNSADDARHMIDIALAAAGSGTLSIEKAHFASDVFNMLAHDRYRTIAVTSELNDADSKSLVSKFYAGRYGAIDQRIVKERNISLLRLHAYGIFGEFVNEQTRRATQG